MKLLRDILYKTRIEEVIGSTNVAIESICFDSRKVERFSFFEAIRGEVSDGHAYIQKAIQTGAIAILCEDIPDQKDEKVTFRVVNYPKFADFLVSVESELGRVTWPSKHEVIQATIVVLVTMLFLGVFLFLIDLLWIWLFSAIGFTEYR